MVFQENQDNGEWDQIGPPIIGDDQTMLERFGYDVSNISHWITYASHSNYISGVAFIYKRTSSGDEWCLHQRINSWLYCTNGGFISLSKDGKTLVNGRPFIPYPEEYLEGIAILQNDVWVVSLGCD